MATVQLNDITLPIYGDYNGIRVGTWSGLGQGDVGEPAELPNFADRTVQVSGTFGAGGSVAVEGSLDGIHYGLLTDPQGNALLFTGPKLETISEVVRFIRPRVEGGDNTTELEAFILFRKG